MSNKTKPLIYLAMILVLVIGVFSICAVVAEDAAVKTTAATGGLKTLTDQTAKVAVKAKSVTEPLSFCEQKKVSKTKLNYNSIIYMHNNPDEACEGRADLAKYNYQKVSIV